MGTNHRGSDKADGVFGLARETADALGRLTIQHLRLARLEIKADLRAMGLQAGLMALLAAVAVVGYGLAMAGLAFVLGGETAAGFPLVILGIAHVVVAGIGIVIAAFQFRRVRLMNTTAGELNLSLAPLAVGTASASGNESEVPRDRS
jgi:uncharacterized membrane protein YqjE